MDFYQVKDADYYLHSRHDIIKIIEENSFKNIKVLEVGASGGYTLVELKKRNIASEVVGFELFKLPNTEQNNELIDKFIIDDIEKVKEIDFPKNYFDIILFPDVLEHLVDPWAVLTKLEPYLKKKGHLIISLPNFRELGNLYKIFLQADFRYTESGILDKTHLRFFCKKNALALINHIPSLKVKECYPSFKKNILEKKRILTNKLTLGLFSDFLAKQYLILIEK